MEIAYHEEIDIVIVGAGICGLATALALHRKGLTSVVVERSESLRDSGGGITIRTNGWKALEQLGVASNLRHKAISLQGAREINLRNGREVPKPWDGETRCLKRTDLITVLAESLPLGTVRLGCQATSVKVDSLTSNPILHLRNGSTIEAKVLIGCDGTNSIVADFLELKPPQQFLLSEVRGLTIYPHGHCFRNEFLQVMGDKIIIGRMPIDDKLVYWFVLRKEAQGKELKVSKDPEQIQKLTLESIQEFPSEIIDMVSKSDQESVSDARLTYRSPWDVLVANFQKGNVTVAGDAMHVMGPFLGQGGSASIEDAIVISRCLAEKIDQESSGRQIMMAEAQEALGKYVKERRMRLVNLSTQTYLIGLLRQDSLLMVKFVCIILMSTVFSDSTRHTRYDCGPL